MNNTRRNLLKKAIDALDTAEAFINTALDEEQDCLDNMPESFEGTYRYEKMESSIEDMEDALSDIDDARSYINNARDRIESAAG